MSCSSKTAFSKIFFQLLALSASLLGTAIIEANNVCPILAQGLRLVQTNPISSLLLHQRETHSFRYLTACLYHKLQQSTCQHPQKKKSRTHTAFPASPYDQPQTIDFDNKSFDL